jgi:tetratricopeptide (TPR) repeat protein
MGADESGTLRRLGFIENREEAFATARTAAEKAVSLDPNEAIAHIVMGATHITAGETEMGIGEMQTAISLNPNLENGHNALAFAYHYGAGQMEQALQHYDTALRLSPRSPTRSSQLFLKGSALRNLGRHNEAVAYCLEACQVPDSGYLPYMHLAAALAESGQIEGARAALETAIQRQPALSISHIRTNFVGMHETTLNSLLNSLRKAGVPEE